MKFAMPIVILGAMLMFLTDLGRLAGQAGGVTRSAAAARAVPDHFASALPTTLISPIR